MPDKEPTHKPDQEALRENIHNINNITGNPDSDGAGNLDPEQRNELALSEFELDAGLGRGPFERPTPIEEAESDHPSYLPTTEQSEEDR
ncbi:MAG: hypothetical protein J0I20_29570 [Chloroflexi bacterium]|nr:hypothetical protein [Chloroflexota bacterium]OJV95972.1 MAG: hypothetical protein BGO39_03820 [Chloroflexi bacterium 54-19]